MSELELEKVLDDASEDFRHGIEQLVYVVKALKKDVDSLSLKDYKPDKLVAEGLLEYIAMEEGNAKKKLEALCGKEIKKYFLWIDNYCKLNKCTQEEALKMLITE